MRNLTRLSWEASVSSQPQPGDLCDLCKQPAPYRVESAGGWKPACSLHATVATRLGYEVNPPVPC